MPSLDLALLFLGVPSVSWAVGAFAVLDRVSDLRARDPLDVPAGSRGRLAMYLMVSATTVFFGLVLWFLLSGIEDGFGPPPQPIAMILESLGIAFAWTAAVATGTQAWVTRVRLRAFVGLDFGRVLPLIVIPNTVVIFDFFLSFVAIGRVSDSTSGWVTLTLEQAGRIGTALVVYAATTVAIAMSSIAAARIPGLTPARNFRRAASITDLGLFPAILALAWALLQIASA